MFSDSITADGRSKYFVRERVLGESIPELSESAPSDRSESPFARPASPGMLAPASGFSSLAADDYEEMEGGGESSQLQKLDYLKNEVSKLEAALKAGMLIPQHSHHDEEDEGDDDSDVDLTFYNLISKPLRPLGSRRTSGESSITRRLCLSSDTSFVETSPYFATSTSKTPTRAPPRSRHANLADNSSTPTKPRSQVLDRVEIPFIEHRDPTPEGTSSPEPIIKTEKRVEFADIISSDHSTPKARARPKTRATSAARVAPVSKPEREPSEDPESLYEQPHFQSPPSDEMPAPPSRQSTQPLKSTQSSSLASPPDDAVDYSSDDDPVIRNHIAKYGRHFDMAEYCRYVNRRRSPNDISVDEAIKNIRVYGCWNPVALSGTASGDAQIESVATADDIETQQARQRKREKKERKKERRREKRRKEEKKGRKDKKEKLQNHKTNEEGKKERKEKEKDDEKEAKRQRKVLRRRRKELKRKEKESRRREEHSSYFQAASSHHRAPIPDIPNKDSRKKSRKSEMDPIHIPAETTTIFPSIVPEGFEEPDKSDNVKSASKKRKRSEDDDVAAVKKKRKATTVTPTIKSETVLVKETNITTGKTDLENTTPSTLAKKRKRRKTVTNPENNTILETLSESTLNVEVVSPSKRVPAGTSIIIPPPLDAETFGLIQEEVGHNPYHLLIAVVFLQKTKGSTAIPVFRDLIKRWPTPEDLITKGTQKEVEDMFQPLGLQATRSKTVWKMAEHFHLHNPYEKPLGPESWKVRNDYRPKDPSGKDRKWGCIIGDVYGCGKYAIDSWRIFSMKPGEGGFIDGTVVGERTKANKDTDADVPLPKAVYRKRFHPGDEEWRRVPDDDPVLDKELKAYVKWMKAKDGAGFGTTDPKR
ncbi:hypothetical protein AA313_de0204320 [Arthrobotrys entomopaga]|nr:hypothetical protein AA313_de0204320 [Arthrobotrys entomopaga]